MIEAGLYILHKKDQIPFSTNLWHVQLKFITLKKIVTFICFKISDGKPGFFWVFCSSKIL